MNLISHFPKIYCGHGDQGQSGWGFVCLKVASIILRPLMTPPDQVAHVQPLNFPRKVPSLPVRDNQGCLLMPVMQSVQGTWIPAAAPVTEKNPANENNQSPAAHGWKLPNARLFCHILSAFYFWHSVEFWFLCVLCLKLLKTGMISLNQMWVLK